MLFLCFILLKFFKDAHVGLNSGIQKTNARVFLISNIPPDFQKEEKLIKKTTELKTTSTKLKLDQNFCEKKLGNYFM